MFNGYSQTKRIQINSHIECKGGWISFRVRRPATANTDIKQPPRNQPNLQEFISLHVFTQRVESEIRCLDALLPAVEIATI
jgi:hypothetical protein